MRLWGDANDYFGKGLSGGHLVVRPPAGSPFAAEEQHHRRQRHPLRRHGRRGLHPGPGGGALLRAQLRRDRGRRGRGRPRLRVHDRWARGRARADRSQLRRRYVGRDRLRVRPQPDLRHAGQPGAGRRRAARRRRPTRCVRDAGRAPRRRDRVAGRGRGCSSAGTTRCSSSSR